MAKYTGNGLEINFNSTAITANLVKSVEVNESAEAHESSGASDTDKTYLAGKKDASVRLDLWDDATYANLMGVFVPTTSASLIVYPQGNTSGKPTRTMTAIVTGRTQGVAHNGVTPVSVELQVSGGITEGSVS